MNKEEFIQFASGTTGETKVFMRRALWAVQVGIIEALALGEDIKFVGFGTFKIKDVAQKIGRNVSTGEQLVIPPTKKCVFEAGTEIKEVISNLKMKKKSKKKKK